MRLHIGKAFNSLKLTDYLEEESAISSVDERMQALSCLYIRI